MKFLIAAFAAIAALLVQPAVAGSVADAPPVEITDTWVRAPLLPQRPAALYFTLRNEDDVAHRLVAVRSAASGRTEIHNHLEEDGVMKMRRLDHVEIAPGQVVAFKPGGLHIMLFEPDSTVVAGATLTATLVFENAGEIEIAAKVRGLRDDPASDH